MTGERTKPLELRSNIFSLSQKIKNKEKLLRKVSSQKKDLRQSYIETMEKLRNKANNKESRVVRNQEDFITTMDRLDNEEETLNLEIKDLSEQRAQLNKNLIDRNASLFIPQNLIIILSIIALLLLCSGLLLRQKNILFNFPPTQEQTRN